MKKKSASEDTRQPSSTLTDGQIQTRRVSRRALLSTALLVAGCVPTATVSDPSGSRSITTRGGILPTGITDQDYAPVNGYTDPAGYGRGASGRSITGGIPSYSDQDSGPFADPYRQPRGSGLTDSDGGPTADPAGYGRRGF